MVIWIPHADDFDVLWCIDNDSENSRLWPFSSHSLSMTTKRLNDHKYAYQPIIVSRCRDKVLHSEEVCCFDIVDTAVAFVFVLTLSEFIRISFRMSSNIRCKNLCQSIVYFAIDCDSKKTIDTFLEGTSLEGKFQSFRWYFKQLHSTHCRFVRPEWNHSYTGHRYSCRGRSTLRLLCFSWIRSTWVFKRGVWSIFIQFGKYCRRFDCCCRHWLQHCLQVPWRTDHPTTLRLEYNLVHSWSFDHESRLWVPKWNESMPL